MIQAILAGSAGGGRIATVFTGRRPGSCVVSLSLPDGTPVVSGQTCVVDPVSTTVATDALTGDFSLTLASGTNVATRKRYLVGDEELSIRSVSGAVCQLWAPLTRDHLAGTAFLGLEVSAVIAPSLALALPFWDGQAEFTPDVGDSQIEIVDCVLRKLPDRLISEIDVRLVLPKLLNAVSAELDLNLSFDAARNNMLMDLGGRDRVHSFGGVDHFRRLCAHRFVLDRELDFGAEWAPDFEKVKLAYEQIRSQVTGQSPRQLADGTVTGPVWEANLPTLNLGRM
jgi:hypothetical protein